MVRLKNYFFFAFYLLFNPRLLLLLLRRIYLPVYIQYEWLKKFRINTIIDVGAYHGNVFKSVSVLFPRAKIYAFEPDFKNYNLIKTNYKLPNLTLSNYALSDKTGKSYFYTHPRAYLSSLLTMKKNTLETKRIRVKTATLDEYFEGKSLKGQIFLKVDTQGSEGLVLKGGKNFIKKVSIIHIETAFVKFYYNQDLFNDIYDFLINSGFKYLGEARESFFYPTFTLATGSNSVFINEKLAKFSSPSEK